MTFPWLSFKVFLLEPPIFLIFQNFDLLEVFKEDLTELFYGDLMEFLGRISIWVYRDDLSEVFQEYF